MTGGHYVQTSLELFRSPDSAASEPSNAHIHINEDLTPGKGGMSRVRGA